MDVYVATGLLLIGACAALLSRRSASPRHERRRPLRTKWSVALASLLAILSGGLSSCGGSIPIYKPPQSDKWTVYFGTGDGYVYALNANNGSQRWKANASGDGGVNSDFPLTVDDKIVAYENSNKGIVPLRADTGAKVKTCQCAAPESGPGPATIVDGVLYSADANDNLQANTLTDIGPDQLWSVQIPGSSIGHAPVVYDGGIFVWSDYSGGYEVYRVDQNTGGNPTTPLWSGSDVAADDSGVYSAVIVRACSSDQQTCYGLQAYPAGWVNRANSDEDASFADANGAFRLSNGPKVAVGGGNVYLAGDTAADPSAAVSAIDESNGKLRWQFDDPDHAQNVVAQSQNNCTCDALWSTPTTAGGVAYISARDLVNANDLNDGWDDKVYALDAVTGALRWSYQLGMHVLRSLSAPVVSGGALYVTSCDNNIINGAQFVGNTPCRVTALNVADGTLRWRFDMPSPQAEGAYVTPTELGAGPDAFYIGATDDLRNGMYEGHVYAINLAGGTKRWEYDSGPTTLPWWNEDVFVTAPVVGPLVPAPPSHPQGVPLPTWTPTPSQTPTITPTPTFTPTPTPTNTPTVTPYPNNAPPIVKVAVTPTSFNQSCAASGALPSFAVTLDNTQSSVAVDWHATITDKDPSNSELWATANPTGGQVGKQRTTQITVTPVADLCSRFGNSSAPVTFHVTFSWTTGGGGSATVSDTVKPYVIG